MSPPASPTLRERLAVLRRRRTAMLAALGVVLAIAVVAAFAWPARYRATGTILIEQQELPEDLVRSTITSYADQRIQVITQRVMTTENLFRIIQQYDLYTDLRKSDPREEVLQEMRDDIVFEMISADVIDPRQGRPTKATIAFSISYTNESPQLAARVANELVSLYIQENIESRRRRTADATTFLTDESTRLNRQITDLQARVATFKERHRSSLPELSATNIQLLNRTDDDLRDVDTQLRTLAERIVYLDAQLVQISPVSPVYAATGERVLVPQDRLKLLRSELARAETLYTSDHPDVQRIRQQIDGLERAAGSESPRGDLQRDLEDARGRLAAARERYGDDHPDLQALSRLVAVLEEQIARLPPELPKISEEADNPAYIQVRAQRQAAVAEQVSLQQKRELLVRRAGDFERRLQAAPGVERDYIALLRELDAAQIKHREVQQKRMEAQVAQNLEEERKGERFTLIEPPLPPEAPASPNRPLILVLGVIAALGAAIGVAALLEALDSSVRSRADLQRLVTVPPLAVLPWIENPVERRARSMRLRLVTAGGAASLLIGLTMLHLFFRPLDVLWQILLRRFGA